MLMLLQIIGNSLIGIFSFIIKLFQKYPWLVIVTLLLSYIVYQKFQISELNHNIDTTNANFTKIVKENEQLYSSYVQEKQSYNDIFNALNKTIENNDSLNKQIKVLSKLIKQRNEKPIEVITFKTDSVTYQDSLLVKAQEENINGRLMISFYRDFPSVKIYGYTLSSPAFSFLQVVEKQRTFKLVKTLTEEGFNRFYITGSPEFGEIKQLEVVSLPTDKPKSFWKSIKPSAYFTYKIPLETFETVAGLNVWRFMPVGGIELKTQGKVSWFYGLRFTLY